MTATTDAAGFTSVGNAITIDVNGVSILRIYVVAEPIISTVAATTAAAATDAARADSAHGRRLPHDTGTKV